MPPKTRRQQQKASKQKVSKQRASKQKTSKQKKQEAVEKKAEKSVEKSQPIPQVQQKQAPIKAKKYKKKTYEEISRIQRSKYQRIFLLQAERREDDWFFMVQGTKGSQYRVNVSTQVHCTCIDFRMHKSPCKHIYFIVTQVGQNEQLLDYFKNDRKISKNAYKILDQQLSSRLKSRMQKPAKQAKDIDLKDDTDCVICFSQMDKNTEPLQDCSTCKKYFHSQCISAWKNHNPSCPLCRGALVGGTDNDPLGKVIGIKL